MKIPTAKELGGMLRSICKDFEMNASFGEYATFKCSVDVNDILQLLKAIGLPEPDFNSEPLSVEEWENQYADKYPEAIITLEKLRAFLKNKPSTDSHE